jgi:hypothetical protein
MYNGYAFFNQTEIWNHNRVLSYMQGDPLNGVPGLRAPTTSIEVDCSCEAAQPLFCDQGAGPNGEYLGVEQDDAPWYDPEVPESTEFAGLFVTGIEGFDSTVRRDVREGAIAGSSLGPLRLAGRLITVTGWLRAQTCCAAEYGLRWLTEALIGGTACENCGLGDLLMLKCCPPDDASECHLLTVDTQELRRVDDFRVSVSDLGGGQYQLVLNDDLQINLVSEFSGAANNTDGFIPTCLDGSDPLAISSFEIVLDGNAAVTELRIPFGAVTSLVTAASGSGAQATLDIDTTFDTGCDPANEALAELTASLDEIIAVFGDAVQGDAISVAEARCQTIGTGPDPVQFNRLLHRVGLVSGPTVTDRFGNCCQSNCGCTNLQVQFTIASELPYLFSEIVWCLEDETFPRDDIYCIDLEFCRNCQNIDPDQLIEVLRPRPECRVSVRYDGTWCPDGWDPNVLGFPPEDCLLVPVVEQFTPPGPTGSGSGDPCLIDLNGDGTWDAVNFDPTDGFVPEHCDLVIQSPNGDPFLCSEQDLTNCTSGGGSGSVLCDVTLVGTPGDSGTWTSPDFDPAVDGFPPNCEIDITNGSVCQPAVDEVQEIRVNATSGTFSLTFDGDTTGALAYNVSETAMRLALEALATLAPGDVEVSGGPGDAGATTPYVVTFGGTLAGTNVSAIIGNNISLAGGGASISVTTTVQGKPADVECAVRLIYNVATGTQTWEGQWPAGSGGDCVCYTVSQFCVEGAEVCLVKIIYDEVTGEATWEPIRWDGDINNDACVCFEIAEIEVITAADDCPPVALVDCGISLDTYNFGTNKGTYSKIGWSWVPSDGDFPPADCDITIPNQSTSPITETISVPAGLFVPDCGPTPIVPPPPFVPFIECYCDPWASFRVCCTFEHPVLWNDATTYIRVDAGSAEIRNMQIQAFQNPFADQGLPCPCDPNDPFWKCREPCTTIQIPQLPSGSSLIIDGRTRVAEVTFAGGTRTNGLRYISSESGRPFEWFDISQCAVLCLIISADCTTLAENATVSVGLSERYLASGG